MFPTKPREHTAGSFYVCHFDELLGDGCHEPKQNHPLYLKRSSLVLLSTKFCQHWQSKINVFRLLNGDLMPHLQMVGIWQRTAPEGPFQSLLSFACVVPQGCKHCGTAHLAQPGFPSQPYPARCCEILLFCLSPVPGNLGCYKDHGNPPPLTGTSKTSNKLTIQTCISFCRSQRFKVPALPCITTEKIKIITTAHLSFTWEE